MQPARTNLAFLAFLCLVALATPVSAWAEKNVAARDGSLLYLQTLDQRIADVSWKIAAANTALCPSTMAGIGISLHDAGQYAPAYRQAAVDTFGFGDGLPSVLALAKGSPAAEAGLRVGDRITSLNGKALPAARSGPRAKEDYAPVAAVMTQLEELAPDQSVRIGIRRGDVAFELTVVPATVCRSRVEVVPGASINANSNGAAVQINGKLAIWTKTDDELATVIGHEMTHNILNHNARIARERIGTGLSAMFGNDGAKLRQMEREADRYGLYLVARAGYDYRVAPDFWRRLTNTSGLGSVWATTHPTARDRAAFNDALVAELDRKIAAREALTP